MKICILGPVTTPGHFGGVAVFDEGLAKGFQKLGHDVLVVSTQSDARQRTESFIRGVRKQKLPEVVNAFAPDLVIASLTYGIYFKFIRHGKKLYYLHGFFNFETYGAVKTLAAVAFQKYVAHLSDCVCAVSHFTAAINRKLWGLGVDSVSLIGIDEDFLSSALKTVPQDREKGQILFAGRLEANKGVEQIIRAVSLLPADQYRLVIVGEGSRREAYQAMAHELKCNADFIGRVAHKEICALYQRSEIFVSLHETENFGTVFAEALISGCKVVCPYTGGQNEYLLDYPERIRRVDACDPVCIANAMRQLMEQDVQPLNLQHMVERFDYKMTALRLMEAVGIEEGRNP